PVSLRLAIDAGDTLARDLSLALDLPETHDRGALGERLARQVDAEWARAGARFASARPAAVTPPAAVPPSAPPSIELMTLDDHLRRVGDRFPADLRPWLGFTAPDVARDLMVSASRLRSFTQCLYRAFLAAVARVRPIDEPEEDLDLRAEGTAI